MKWIIMGAMFFFGMVGGGQAENVFFYRTYDQKTKKIINHFTITIQDIKNGQREVDWKKEEGSDITEEKYILDSNYATLRWTVDHPEDQTYYTGERQGRFLILQGNFKGKPFQKNIKIDDRPFYYNPKLGLTAFVFSGREKAKFWALRHDDLTEHLMEARNKGTDVIILNGKKIESVKVHWTLPDFRSAFFRRTYWFRKSDALYIRQKTSGHLIKELIQER